MPTTARPPRSPDAEATSELDVLPRLDPRARRGAVGPEAGGPGRYLVAEGDGAQQVLRLADGVTRIGRGFTADVRLDDHTVSRRHALIVGRPEGARVLDDRSANGTFVNGRRVSEAELGDGDVLVIGRYVLTFRVIP